MLQETVQKITLAGFLHDVGKFAERAGFEVPDEYINSNSTLYQPIYKGNYTHKHAIYTAAFIELLKEDLPDELNQSKWGFGDSFVNLAASHHKPETPMQWIIAVADRISSGMDRDTFDRYNQSHDVKDYKKTRLVSVLEEINITEPTEKDLQYRYHLKPFTAENIFPVLKNEAEPENYQTAENQYKILFNEFLEGLKGLYHKKQIHLWIEHFDSLYQLYTSFIPAVTVGDITPDVSLYDHSKTTAALAAALYLYHYENGDIENINSIIDYSQPKLLFITGDFYGIQDFIFSKGGSTQRAAAKLLRGRSFYISLLSELAADLICRKIGLTPLSVVLSAAGKFTIVAPNTSKTIEAIQQAREEMDEWFYKHFFSESSIGISMVEASPENLTSEQFPFFWQKVTSGVNQAKYKRLDLKRYAGVVSDYLHRFSSLCPFCGKRPSELTYEKESICGICHDHIILGRHIVKESPNIAITEGKVDITGEHTRIPIFEKYHIYLDVSGELRKVAKEGTLLRYWSLSMDGNEEHLKFAKKNINNYIPRHPKIEDIDDTYIERLLWGDKSEEKKNELFDAIKKGEAKSFLHIAKEALVKKDKYYGVEALGILKADIDNLGLIFAIGLKDSDQRSRITISRLATLSRMINSFFAIHLPYQLKTNSNFSNIYTVFAGGDDLFLIGPWNKMIDFARQFYRDFRSYFCFNPDFTISAGIVIVKPDFPVHAIASVSENALDEAKAEKDCLNVFGVNIKWEHLDELFNIKNNLYNMLENNILTRVMLYKINKIVEMVQKENTIKKAYNEGKTILIEEMEALKWRAFLRYHLARNIGRTIKDKQQREDLIKKLVENFTFWLETHRDQIRLPLWSLLYETRSRR